MTTNWNMNITLKNKFAWIWYTMKDTAYFMARYSDSENPSNGLSGELIVTWLGYCFVHLAIASLDAFNTVSIGSGSFWKIDVVCVAFIFIFIYYLNLPDITRYSNLVWGCLKRRLTNKLVRSCRNCWICYPSERLQHGVTFLVYYQTSSVGVHWAI